jgi:metal-dependent amidase/aminoacylase/carboxypeptidase family protein
MRWSEDFGYYLEEAEGAFFGIGDGQEHPQLHTQQYSFPDEIIPDALAVFASLIE